MFNSIPQNRLVLYFMLAGLVPIIIAWISFASQMQAINELKTMEWRLQDQAFNREKKQSVNMAVRSHFRDADHFYIDKNLETLTLLEPEIESLKKMLNDPHFPEDEHIKKRLDLLVGAGNSMSFTEGVVQATPIFQEVSETLVHPVEVNVSDLRHILCLIEGLSLSTCTPPLNRPQLNVLEFKIDKKTVSEKNQVFLMNLKLLKREFL
jgi:hypothetical protein